ncbi:hypothetical protein [Halorubellus sp. PRR65]|uniref:hypothetical protein n=1 Tax=Halorubellus sp. PRR65 TaxID=3098148 RepID=UPI002B263E3C|nr:hypothetical protein [Halorubellus sp. PRR65]
MRRRTVLSAVGATAGAVATAGCLTGGSDDDSTAAGDDTSASAAGTAAATTALGDDGGEDANGDGTKSDADAGGSANVDFEASVVRIEKCSATCRTLTYALENRGADPAPDVVVRIRVFTGGEKVWDEERSVGGIDAGDERPDISRDIDVGLLGGGKIKRNDGEVDIRLTARAAGVSETFAFERTLDV